MGNPHKSALAFAGLVVAASASQLSFINPLIGNGGDTPNGSGGMIPSVAPPFGMTRWVGQTHENYVSRTPYNVSDAEVIHGFQGTHQPAIWMGESGNVAVVPGVGQVLRKFDERGMKKQAETIGPVLYSVDLLAADGGNIKTEMSASAFSP